MDNLKYHTLNSNPGAVPVVDIPVLDYEEFRTQTARLLKNERNHCLSYFVHETGGRLIFYMLIANDASGRIHVYSHVAEAAIRSIPSLSRDVIQLAGFEREIAETTGIVFEEHPWPKPLRYPFDSKPGNREMAEYPFYRIMSEETHEVGVGPIHAGIIEPGHFRFECYGEKVLHLEIQLGYQHRGVESRFTRAGTMPEMAVLSECIAGDSAIAHGLAFSQLAEILSGAVTTGDLAIDRIIALEMERIAIHIGDLAALCGDVAFQTGQVACEALRTIVINTMQDWCGNRFGKGLVRPGGTYYPLNKEKAEMISGRLAEVKRRFSEVAEMIFHDSGIIARFENTGAVSSRQAYLAGATGMAARSSGLNRDLRKSHPFQSYSKLDYTPFILDQGDVLARALLRKKEIELSYTVIDELIKKLGFSASPVSRPDYSMKYASGLMGVSLVEGWRGEICHTALTGENGKLMKYKIKDPSFHNWQMLALAVRQQEISDFPVCNKSFNLSYCGHDL